MSSGAQQLIEDFEKVLRLPDTKRRVPKKDLMYGIAENYRQMKDWGMAVHWGKLALEADPKNERHRQLFKEVSAKSGLKSS